jgi:peptidoglycan/xylan/chitin deacetylase (PgdA/CDA1 family)
MVFLRSRGIRTTWFTAGFTIESFPRKCEAVATAGHEIAHHSWAHVPPANQSREEEADPVRANEAILGLTGRVAPMLLVARAHLIFLHGLGGEPRRVARGRPFGCLLQGTGRVRNSRR